MERQMLTKEDIKKVWDSVQILSEENVINNIVTGGLRPILMNNGYRVTLSIDRLRKDLELFHLSVSKSEGETDPADAEHIAKDILGEGYIYIGNMYHRNVLHFVKKKR